MISALATRGAHKGISDLGRLNTTEQELYECLCSGLELRGTGRTAK